MDDGSLSGLLLILSLAVVHGLITLAYSALNNVRLTPLREQAENGNKSAIRVLKLTHISARVTITWQLVSVLLLFSMSAMLVAWLEPLIISLALPMGPTEIIAVLLTAAVTVVLAVVVPDSIGAAYANTIAPLTAMPLGWIVTVLSPLTAIVLFASRVISSIFASSDLVNRVTEEEIITLVETGHTGGTIEDEEASMIYSVLRLDETHASEVMVPRIDMIGIEIDTPLDEARAEFIRSGYSRIPIYRDNIDNIQGILYAKDLLTYWHNGNREKIKGIADLMRPAYFVPETKAADELLKELQTRRVHIAIVVDEYGGTAGLVTIENIIEEIIGDIQDEYDLEEEEYVQVSENEYIVDAGIDLDHFNDLLDVDISTDDNDTLGGFIYTELERIPVVGEEIQYESKLMLRVESVDGRRIRKVHVTRQYPQLDDDVLEELEASAPANSTVDVNKENEEAGAT